MSAGALVPRAAMLPTCRATVFLFDRGLTPISSRRRRYRHLSLFGGGQRFLSERQILPGLKDAEVIRVRNQPGVLRPACRLDLLASGGGDDLLQELAPCGIS